MKERFIKGSQFTSLSYDLVLRVGLLNGIRNLEVWRKHGNEMMYLEWRNWTHTHTHTQPETHRNTHTLIEYMYIIMYIIRTWICNCWFGFSSGIAWGLSSVAFMDSFCFFGFWFLIFFFLMIYEICGLSFSTSISLV